MRVWDCSGNWTFGSVRILMDLICLFVLGWLGHTSIMVSHWILFLGHPMSVVGCNVFLFFLVGGF